MWSKLDLFRPTEYRQRSRSHVASLALYLTPSLLFSLLLNLPRVSHHYYQHYYQQDQSLLIPSLLLPPLLNLLKADLKTAFPFYCRFLADWCHDYQHYIFSKLSIQRMTLLWRFSLWPPWAWQWTWTWTCSCTTSWSTPSPLLSSPPCSFSSSSTTSSWPGGCYIQVPHPLDP